MGDKCSKDGTRDTDWRVHYPRGDNRNYKHGYDLCRRKRQNREPDWKLRECHYLRHGKPAESQTAEEEIKEKKIWVFSAVQLLRSKEEGTKREWSMALNAMKDGKQRGRKSSRKLRRDGLSVCLRVQGNEPMEGEGRKKAQREQTGVMTPEEGKGVQLTA